MVCCLALGRRGNQILGNYIGLGSDGSTSQSNLGDGVHITGNSNGNIVGGSNTGEGNVISKSGDDGIEINGSNNNQILGNYIGTDATGLVAKGNTNIGIAVNNGASSNAIGGSNPGEGNVIAANGQSGVFIKNLGTSNNVVEGNNIGVGADGTTPLGNGKKGVFVSEDASQNTIGGIGANDGNLIANNSMMGVRISGANTVDNAILRNIIYDNTGLGIDLDNNGTSEPIDSMDPDSGANNLQNFPTITSAIVNSAGNQVTIVGALDSLPGRDFRIEFFKNDNSETYGEAEAYLGYVDVTTNGAGIANFSPTLSADTRDQWSLSRLQRPNWLQEHRAVPRSSPSIRW